MIYFFLGTLLTKPISLVDQPTAMLKTDKYKPSIPQGILCLLIELERVKYFKNMLI